MALIDRKIPIITGINDTPSTNGQPNHPNASLLCKQYNDLIDNELTALSDAVSALQGGGGGSGLSRTALYKSLFLKFPYRRAFYFSKNLSTGNITELSYTGNLLEDLLYSFLDSEGNNYTVEITDYSVDGGSNLPLSTNNTVSFGTINIVPSGNMAIILGSDAVYGSIYATYSVDTVGTGIILADIIVIPNHNTITV